VRFICIQWWFRCIEGRGAPRVLTVVKDRCRGQTRSAAQRSSSCPHRPPAAKHLHKCMAGARLLHCQSTARQKEGAAAKEGSTEGAGSAPSSRRAELLLRFSQFRCWDSIWPCRRAWRRAVAPRCSRARVLNSALGGGGGGGERTIEGVAPVGGES